jgi:protein-S-isoprenylcysteine O-methyltransferase Ste14
MSRPGPALRSIAFTLVVPGAGGVYGPWLILARRGSVPAPADWYAAAFHLVVTCYEEPHLATRFGEPYAAYRRAVRRWVPRRPAAGPGQPGPFRARRFTIF